MHSPRGSRLCFLILSFNYKICDSIWDFTLPQILFLLKVKEEEKKQLDRMMEEEKGSVGQSAPAKISFSPDKDSPEQITAKAKSLEALFSQFSDKK